LTGAASRDLPEVGELDLQRDGAPPCAGALAMRPYLFDDVPQLIASRLIGDEICGKRVLGANRFSYPIGADAAIIDGARRPIEVGARLPEILLKESQRLPFEVEPGPDPK